MNRSYIVEHYTKVNCVRILLYEVPYGFLLLLTKMSGRGSSQEQGLYGKDRSHSLTNVGPKY
ncbi:hypothetical protein HanRHA438_Chr11g0495251 [Helianthus annuus]|nr:hypothetical protein HanIR_Chr11g0519181 [Helianthus annuus]KAJ0869995.1 hypothetical protein HanRHA438_Chr11g0495251 [Helianthus annuus]